MITIRAALPADVPQIRDLARRVYNQPGMYAYPASMLAAHIQNFPEGQFVALQHGVVVGYAASIQINAQTAFAQHDWWSVTGYGRGSTHNPDGDWLYGTEVMTEPALRRQGVAGRLYDARKELCRRLSLRGIVVCARMPGLAASGLPPQQYVQQRAAQDPVLAFQLRQGFQIEGLVENYLPDPESLDWAARLVWRVV